MTPQDGRAAAPSASPPRASPPARSRAATSRCCAGYENAIGLDMGGTSTDISLVYRRRGADHEGVVRRVRLPDLLPLDRGADDRRRRRLAGLDRRGRLAAQRPAVGGRRPRARRATGAATTSRRTPTPTSCSAGSARELIGGAMTLDRRRPRSARSRSSAGTLGLDAPDAAQARHPGRQRQHGRRRAADLDPPRLRPARVRARRLRRRGRAARRRPRARALDPDGDRAAEPGHHLRARVPARRRPPRPHGDVPAPQVADGRPRATIEAEFPQLEARGARAARGRGRPARSGCQPRAARSTCATSASGGRSRSPVEAPLDPRRRRSRRFHAEHEREYAYRARRRAGRDLPLNVRAVGVTPKPELAAPRADAARRRAARARGPCVFDVAAGRPTRRSTCATTCPRAPRSTGPAIVEQLDSTVVVPPGWRAEVDEWLNIRMHDAEAAGDERPRATATRSTRSPSRC